jgi:serine phosphatase RsbU (regulator of sigma subunit)
LGMRLGLELTQSTVDIGHGDLLLLFTDGLPEAVDSPSGESFGFQRLKDLLADVGSPRAVHDRILLAFDQHIGHEPLTDDLTLMVAARS